MVCVALGVDMFDCVFPTRTAVSIQANYLRYSFEDEKHLVRFTDSFAKCHTYLVKL